MAIGFVVEDGSGKSDATSYVSLNEADQFHENHGSTDWSALSQDEKYVALISATSYIDSYFTWVHGRRTNETQALDWPRIGAYDEDEYYFDETEVPQQVKDACCALALRASSEDIVSDSERPVKAFKAGSVSVEFEEGTSGLNTYNQVNALLKGLVTGFGSTVRLDLI
jgi:hypothetical protein